MPEGAAYGLVKGMMKFAGYSLAVSSTPISSNFVKNRCRLSVGTSHWKLNSLSSFSAYTQNEHSHDKSVMVAKYYLPPWFRCVCGLLFLCFPFIFPICMH